MWNQQALKNHIKAAKILCMIKNQTINHIRKNKSKLTDYDVQQFILNKFKENNLKTDKYPPIVSINRNTPKPHYYPEKNKAVRIGKNSLIMIDLWARLNQKNSPFADMTWMCSVGKPSKKIIKIFNIVLNARNNALSFIRKQIKQRKLPKAKQIDKVARSYISSKKYGKFFLHRTGHVLGFYSDHGKGTNISKASKGTIEFNTGYTIEPAIYFKNRFGVRTEIDFYISRKFKLVVTTDQQKKITIV